ncbi:hypothetical protein CK203_042306 [Vitis vinifera]|uniref:SnoaL-like domain-containing protein n=1 Tax=Vitis vinifera TaxID=29760 RepID=A0A438H7M8_VITVI|nr:hypothetical protein CK203_042306 [Vitis vinifera]
MYSAADHCRSLLHCEPNQSCSYNPWLNLKSILKRQPQRAQVFNDPLLSLSNQAVGQGKKITELWKAVQKLYTAIKNKNVKEVSDVIGDECRCFCNFISASQPFHGKKQALEFFDHLMKILGDHASIKFSFTMHDGMAVGVTWRLEWKNNPVPLGTGFSYYVCQEYRGRVVIKNVNMLMDPLIPPWTPEAENCGDSDARNGQVWALNLRGARRLTVTFGWWVEATLLGQGHGKSRVDAKVGEGMLVAAQAVHIGLLDDCTTLFSRRGW